MKYFFSGLDSRYASIFWPPLPDAGLMFSAATLLLPEMQDLCELYRKRGILLVLDCGMVQGTVTEDAYIEILCRWGDAFTWFASMDTPGNLGTSNGTYNYLRDYLPEDLWSKLLYVLQGEIAQGFTEDQYQTLLTVFEQATPYVGIGGLVRYCRRGQFRLIERYLDQIVDRLGVARCQQIHLFGVGNYRVLHRYRNIFASADSSTYLCGAHGEQLQPQGGRRPCTRSIEKLQLLRENAEMLLSWCAADQPVPTSPLTVPAPAADPYLLETLVS